jgi:PAS domain-containing protein
MLAESTGQRRDGAEAVRRANVGEPAAAARPQTLALDAAPCLGERYTSGEHERKLVARRLQLLIDLTREAAESGDLDELDQYLDGIASAGAQGGFCDADFFLASAETRRALLDSRVINGSHAGLYSYWQTLRHAEDYFLRRVAAHLETQRRPEDRPTIALLEQLPQALILIDEDARIHYANSRIKPLFGLRPRDATGRSLFDLAKPRLLSLLVDPSAFITATARIVTSPSETHEDVFQLQNGSTYIRRSLPLKPEGLLRNLITVTDLTPPQCQPMPRTPMNARPPENRATERSDPPDTPATLMALDSQLDQTTCARGSFVEHHRPLKSQRPTSDLFPSPQW